MKTVVTLRVEPLCTEHSLQYFDNCTLVHRGPLAILWHSQQAQLAIPFQSVVVLRELVHLWWFYYFENCPPGAPPHASWCITPHTLVHWGQRVTNCCFLDAALEIIFCSLDAVLKILNPSVPEGGRWQRYNLCDRFIAKCLICNAWHSEIFKSNVTFYILDLWSRNDKGTFIF